MAVAVGEYGDGSTIPANARKEVDMTDRLGEALAWYMTTNELLDLPLSAEAKRSIEAIAAAARAWHTLTQGRALIIERDEKGEWPIKLRGLLGSWAHRWPDLPANSVLDTLYDTLAVEALTVTPTPEDDDASIH